MGDFFEVAPTTTPVLNGGQHITYFANKADADANGTQIGSASSYDVGSGGGSTVINSDPGATNPYLYWGLSSTSVGDQLSTFIYINGTTLSSSISDNSYDPATQSASYLLYPVNIVYYNNQADALNDANPIDWNTGDYIVGNSLSSQLPAEVTQWVIASISTGTSSQTGFVTNGDVLDQVGTYILYPYSPSVPCFLEGTNILCQIDGQDSYTPIETIKPGMLVKTALSGYKKVEVIGSRVIENPAHLVRTEPRLYKCSPTNYPELQKDLFITGCHSILVNKITDIQKEKTIRSQGRVFITDRKYRLMACIDDRAEPWASEGKYTIWHFALEHTDVRMNYGVYAEGLLVETSSIRYMKNYSNMSLVK